MTAHTMRSSPADSSNVFNFNERDSILSTDKYRKICCSTRYHLAVICCLGISFTYALRMNVSIAIVEMANGTSSPERGNVAVCPTRSNSSPEYYIKKAKVYDWSSDTHGWILGAFFYGYLVFQIPGGYLSISVGPKLVIGISVLGNAVSTLLIPLAADLGAPYVIALRVLAGVLESPLLSNIGYFWASWAPPHERSRLLALVNSGMYFGYVISLTISGFICYYLGWTCVFYIFGACGLAWCLLWFWMASDTPETHRNISDTEREYIITSLRGQLASTRNGIPWGTILKSLPVWAICTARLSLLWVTYMLLTMLPTYMKEILGFDIRKNAILSAVPFMSLCLFINVSGLIADYLNESRKFTTSPVRKGCCLIGLVGCAIFLISTGYVGCDYTLAVALLTISTALVSFAQTAIAVNVLEIAPKYSGILVGLVMTFSTISGMVAPSTAKALTRNATIEGWQRVFWIAGGISVFGGLFFTIFAKTEVQPWALD